MKILILYFSGSGNTYFIANKISEELDRLNYEVKLASVEKFQPNAAKEFDAIIMGYPIYACDMPLFLQDYISKLTLPTTKKIILFSTMSFYEGNASRKIGKRLRKSGLIPIHFESIKMPGSDGLIFMKKNSKMVKKILATNYDESESVNKLVNNIINSVNNLLNYNNPKLPSLKYGGIVIGGLMDITYKLVEKKLKKKFYADDKCIKCHLCENNCPANNITVKDEGIIFSDKCYLCMRCINQCPVEAIQIGSKTIDKFRWKGPYGHIRNK